MTGSRASQSPAPTRRLGDDRRRFPRSAYVFLAAAIAAAAVSGCIGFAVKPGERSPVPAGPIGQILADPNASGPPIECRNVTRDRCLSAGSIEGMIADIEVSDAERVIVSCDGVPCTEAGGAMRVDLLLRDGSTVEVARGGYGEFDQP